MKLLSCRDFVAGISLCLWLMGCSSVPRTSVAADTLVPHDVQASPTAEFLGQMLPITATAAIANTTIHLEVARTPEQQALGLMYRTSLADDRGMLFEFKPPRSVSFWMKNCKISLDMIFLRQGVVKYIAPQVPPCDAEPCPSYGPNLPINQVIELRGGRAAELGLKVGDRVPVRFLPSPLQP
jgi:uncharacterized protein